MNRSTFFGLKNLSVSLQSATYNMCNMLSANAFTSFSLGWSSYTVAVKVTRHKEQKTAHCVIICL